MNYETIKLLCKDGNPEDTITVKIKDLKLIIQEIKSEKFRLTTFEELENDRYRKNFRLYCEFLENELTNESLMLLKSTNLHDLVKYYNKDHCSIRLLNCLTIWFTRIPFTPQLRPSCEAVSLITITERSVSTFPPGM